MPSASNNSKRPTRLSPRPRINLIVSIAWMEPTIPGRTPSTPPSAQEGTRPGGGGSALWLADIAGAKSDLTLEIGEVDYVKVNQPEFSDARGGKIQTKWRAESSSADEQHLGVLQLQLPLHADFRHDEMAAVTQNLFVGKARCRFCTRLRLCGGGHSCSLLLYDANSIVGTPPAMEGIMLIVSPSFVGVFSFAR